MKHARRIWSQEPVVAEPIAIVVEEVKPASKKRTSTPKKATKPRRKTR